MYCSYICISYLPRDPPPPNNHRQPSFQAIQFSTESGQAPR